MSRLTRDETAEPVSRDQIFRRERGQGDIHFPCQLTMSRIDSHTRLIHTLAICVTIQGQSLWVNGVQKIQHRGAFISVL